jgi:tRNA threonylcarbamoyladenosine biosynthesis protein TsaB
MERALAIETAGRDGSVALVEDGAVVAEAVFSGGFKHASGLLPLVDRLIRERNWRPRDLDHLYVSVGPGSFTGIRIGVTVAKTLALATPVRLVAVPTLAVVVENAPTDAIHAVVLLDAKRGQVFTARFERTVEGWVEREPAHLDSLATVLARSPRTAHLLGEGIPHHVESIPTDDPGIILTAPEQWLPRASVVARIGARLAAAGRFIDPDALLPTYLRMAEAEEKYQAAQTASVGG